MKSTLFSPPRRKAIVATMMMAAAAAAASELRPRKHLSQHLMQIELEKQVPQHFGDFEIDRGLRPLVADPTVQAGLDVLYDQVLARTYRNAKGERVMLTIAYGADQSSERTQVHRPEICYSAQGFRVRAIRDDMLQLTEHRVPVRRLLTQLGQRIEPVSYWVTLGDRVTLPGTQRKIEQVKLAFAGWIADGLLLRVSSIQPDLESAYALQDHFLQQLERVIAVDSRQRYFGGA